MFGLKAKHIDAINACFAQYPQIEQVILYGSRANGNYKNGSDIDLTIVGDLDYNNLLKLENQLDDLLLPYKMDLSLKHKITNPDLLEQIERVGKVFYEKEKQPAVHEPQVEYGKKPSDWKTYKLGEIAEVFTGFPFKGDLYNDSDGTKVLRGENVTIGNLRWDTVKYWNEEFSQFDKYELKEKDIVIGMDGSRVGKNRAQIRSYDLPLLLAQRVARIRAKKGIDQDFLAQVIKSNRFEGYVKLVQTGTSIPHISAKQIKEFEITAPDLPTQRQIASILSSLDDKIEINLQMNQTLEAMAQAIFKEWFVNFNFPKSLNLDYPDLYDEQDLKKENQIKKNQGNQENPKNQGSDNGLPKGWRNTELGEVTTLIAGGDKPKQFSEQSNELNEVPIYSNGISNEGLYGYTNEPRIIEESVTVSARGTIGFVCLRLRPYLPIVRLISVIPNRDILTAKYLYFWLLNQNISGTGTTQQQLTVPDFRRFNILIPDFQTISEFTKIVDSFYQKIDENKNQIQSLTQTRDTLLPRLMSGSLNLDFLDGQDSKDFKNQENHTNPKNQG